MFISLCLGNDIIPEYNTTTSQKFELSESQGLRTNLAALNIVSWNETFLKIIVLSPKYYECVVLARCVLMLSCAYELSVRKARDFLPHALTPCMPLIIGPPDLKKRFFYYIFATFADIAFLCMLRKLYPEIRREMRQSWLLGLI